MLALLAVRAGLMSSPSSHCAIMDSEVTGTAKLLYVVPGRRVAPTLLAVRCAAALPPAGIRLRAGASASLPGLPTSASDALPALVRAVPCTSPPALQAEVEGAETRWLPAGVCHADLLRPPSPPSVALVPLRDPSSESHASADAGTGLPRLSSPIRSCAIVARRMPTSAASIVLRRSSSLVVFFCRAKATAKITPPTSRRPPAPAPAATPTTLTPSGGDTTAIWMTASDALKLGETLALTDGVGVSDAEAEADTLALALWLGVAVSVAEGESVEVPLLLLDAVPVGVLVSVALADSEADGVGVCGGREGREGEKARGRAAVETVESRAGG
jgi:hypothetical protein